MLWRRMMDHNHVFWAVMLPCQLHEWSLDGWILTAWGRDRERDRQTTATKPPPSLSGPNLLYSQVNQTISVTIKYKRRAGTEINYPWNRFVLAIVRLLRPESRFPEYEIKLHKVENINNWWHRRIRRWTVNCHLLKCVPCTICPIYPVRRPSSSAITHQSHPTETSKAQDGVDREPRAGASCFALLYLDHHHNHLVGMQKTPPILSPPSQNSPKGEGTQKLFN